MSRRAPPSGARRATCRMIPTHVACKWEKSAICAWRHLWLKRLSLSWPPDQLPCAQTGNDGRQSVPFGNRSHCVGSITPVCRVPQFPDIGNFDLPGAAADDTILRIARRPVIQCDDVALVTERCFAGRWLARSSAGTPEHARSAIENLHSHIAGAASAVVGLDRDIDACSILHERPHRPPSREHGATCAVSRRPVQIR